MRGARNVLRRATAPAPYRFTGAEVTVERDAATGASRPVLRLDGPPGDWRSVRAAALRVMADAEDLLGDAYLPALDLDASDRDAMIACDGAIDAGEAAIVVAALNAAGRIARGLAGWTTRPDGSRVLVSVPGAA